MDGGPSNLRSCTRCCNACVGSCTSTLLRIPKLVLAFSPSTHALYDFPAQGDAAAPRPLVAGPWAAAWEGPHSRRVGAPVPQTWAMGIPLAGQASMPSIGALQGLGNPKAGVHGGALPPWPPAAAAAAQRMPDLAQGPKPYPHALLPGLAVAPLRRAASGASLLSATSSDASTGELGGSSGEDEPSLAGLTLGVHEGRPRSVPASPSSVLTGPYRRAAAAAAALDARKPSDGRAADATPASTYIAAGKPERPGGHSRSASAGSADGLSVVGGMAGRAGGAAGAVGSGLGLPPAQAAAVAPRGLGPLSALPLASAPPPAAVQNPRQGLEGPLAGPAVGWAPVPYPAVFEPAAGKAGMELMASRLADAGSPEPALAEQQADPVVGTVLGMPEVLAPMHAPAVHRRRPTLRRRLLRLLLAHRPRSGGHHHRREGRP